MDKTKVQIGNDVLLDIGTHSDWYISVVSYDGESVDIKLHRKTDQYKEWWLADTPQFDSGIPKNALRSDCTGCRLSPVEDEPTTQTETQNSNLTFKTLEYCDICDHKGCEECIANALDEHCMPSQFKKQIEDECAKEYEELGLKELKELIKADRKTESNSEKPNNCEVKNYCDDCLYTYTCDSKEFFYACTSKATISKMEQVDKDINVRSKESE